MGKARGGVSRQGVDRVEMGRKRKRGGGGRDEEVLAVNSAAKVGDGIAAMEAVISIAQGDGRGGKEGSNRATVGLLSMALNTLARDEKAMGGKESVQMAWDAIEAVPAARENLGEPGYTGLVKITAVAAARTSTTTAHPKTKKQRTHSLQKCSHACYVLSHTITACLPQPFPPSNGRKTSKRRRQPPEKSCGYSVGNARERAADQTQDVQPDRRNAPCTPPHRSRPPHHRGKSTSDQNDLTPMLTGWHGRDLL